MYRPMEIRGRLHTGGKTVAEIKERYTGQGLTYRGFESLQCQRHLKMSFFAEKKCHFSPGSIQVYTALITVPLVGLKPVKS